MQNLRNPIWILVVNTLPVMVLLFIFFGEFSIIESLLKEENIALWKSFVWVLVVLSSLNFIYALYLILKKKQVSIYYSILALLSYIPFIYLFGYHSDDIIPFSIPRWMLSGDLIMYVGTFLMPTLAYALFVLVTALTSNDKKHKAWQNFLIAIAIPILLYVFLQVIAPLWQSVNGAYEMHVMLIIIIVCTLVFLFFLIRGIYIISTKKSSVLKKYQYVWKIPILIILPLIGLLVNNGYLFHTFGSNNASGFFGNFNHPWFYILAILNGILICLPNLEKKKYRLFLMIGRGFSFAFSFYFFIVFLPFLPISVIAIIAVGTGFLLLAPLAVFMIHINVLAKDFAFLKEYFSKKVIWTLAIVSFLILPMSITTTYIQDRNTLHKTLDYVYSPNYSKTYDIDQTSLKKTLGIVKGHKEGNRDFILNGQQPYLSSYYNWLVLDNLTLSNAKINTIERIFFNENKEDFWSRNSRNKEVTITDITSSSTFDSSQNVWKSWIDLEITNTRNLQFREYATTIALPEGAWISDYYLYIDDTKEMGILAEKKAAMWVYSNIRNENRDPGILYYLNGNKVAFKVFPFGEKEVRKTGIEILHKDPIQLTIDDHQVHLGEKQQEGNTTFENDHAVYISPKEKQHLKVTERTPYLHFITDVSNKKDNANAIAQINHLIHKYPSVAKNAKISYVNSYVHTEVLREDWKQRLATQSFEGGFYADRAIKTALYDAYVAKEDSYPIIVVITDSIQNAIFDTNFSDWKFTFPESDFFYTLGKDNKLQHHSLTSNPAIAIQDSLPITFNHKTIVYQDANNGIHYLRNDSLPSIVLKEHLFTIPVATIKEKNWASALTLQASWKSQILHPEIADKEWLSLVKSSFVSKIMTPVTSYLVVENEAQKAILKKKQQQVLSGKKSLDLGEDTQRMSEPSIYIVAILLGSILWYRKKRKHKLATYKKKEL
ncbi:MSEP-CTERM sorting domain-containing protein [uncultured Dokdonia sp.]|uniref:MSEP-CTERM sorting domain-containing protein n=1 Tax=uncultured Dokdonia sp. TaxID=575653 RepID=UPI002631CF8F|nr:MSEP-CTERM sorting domain-containing protein [uncultured Dokdonia sp.]